MWEPPEYPGPCFDLHFDRFDGFMTQVLSRYSDHFGHVCDVVAFRFGFTTFRIQFHEWFKFRAMLDHFGRICCVVAFYSVSLRFEFSFMNGSSFELCSDHFGR